MHIWPVFLTHRRLRQEDCFSVWGCLGLHNNTLYQKELSKIIFYISTYYLISANSELGKDLTKNPAKRFPWDLNHWYGMVQLVIAKTWCKVVSLCADLWSVCFSNHNWSCCFCWIFCRRDLYRARDGMPILSQEWFFPHS